MIQVYSPSTYPRGPVRVGKSIEKWILYLVVLGIAGISLYWFILGKGKTFEVTLDSTKGTVEFRENENDSWKAAMSVPLKLKNSVEIRTLADSEAAISISEGSKVNLGSYSRIVLSKNQGEISWVQTDGVSHHQIGKTADRKKYKVAISDGEIEAQGTAFEVKIKETDTSILVFKDQVRVTYKDKSTAEAKAGEEILINPVGRKVKEIDDQDLREEWTLNNLKNDYKNNLSIDPAVLAKAGVKDENIQEITSSGETTVEPEDPNKQEKTTSVNNEEQKKENQSGDVNLQVKQSSNGVLLAWTGAKEGIEGWKIIKGTSSELTYPSDSYRSVSKDETSYLWEMSGDGNIYYFRLCGFNSGNCAMYSNSANIEVSSSSSSSESNSITPTSSATPSAQSSTANQNTGSTSRKLCEGSGGHWTKSTGQCKCPSKEVFVASAGKCKKK